MAVQRTMLQEQARTTLELLHSRVGHDDLMLELLEDLVLRLETLEVGYSHHLDDHHA